MGSERLDHAILAAILDIGDEAYAVPVRDHVERRLQRTVARGALYTTLSRLEGKGWVRSWMGEPLPVRGGRRRRYYALTPTGRVALNAALESTRLELRNMAAVLRDRA